MNTPLIVISGPTASGKTSLAIELARVYNGEIICADSRTIYKYMDIGTAKPSIEEQSIVPHHGLDLVEPGEYFSASDFKAYADLKIKEIRSRGKVPFLVGGTGLYIDSVIYNFEFGSKSDVALRAKLEKMTISELYNIYNDRKLALPENKLNKRYLIRGIELNGITPKSSRDLADDTIVVGISTEKIILRDRINKRSDQIFENGVIEEAKLLAEKFGWDNEAMTGNIYRLVRKYINNEISFEEMKQKNSISDWHLAKRQLTWLKRSPHIIWGSLGESKKYLIGVLENIR